MPEKTFFVECPCCQTKLEVSAKTGKILEHWKKTDLKESGDFLKTALKNQEKDKARLDKYFSNINSEEKKRKANLLNKFEEEKKRIHKEKDYDKPASPFDLD